MPDTPRVSLKNMCSGCWKDFHCSWLLIRRNPYLTSPGGTGNKGLAGTCCETFSAVGSYHLENHETNPTWWFQKCFFAVIPGDENLGMGYEHQPAIHYRFMGKPYYVGWFLVSLTYRRVWIWFVNEPSFVKWPWLAHENSVSPRSVHDGSTRSKPASLAGATICGYTWWWT